MAAAARPQPIRVLRVIARMNVGGPALHIAALAGGLPRERYDSVLVTGEVGPGEVEAPVLAELEGPGLVRLPYLGPALRPWRDLRTLLALVGLVRRFRPQIVETHTAKAGFLGRLAALTLRPRPVIIHTYHGHVLEGYFGRAQTAIFQALERLMAKVSDVLVGVSQITVDDLVRMRIAPREKFRVVPHGLELDHLLELERPGDQGFREEVGAGADDVLFVFIGRLVPIKRVDILLRAVTVAARAEPSVKLAVVGGGESGEELEALADELGLDGRVAFCGYRTDLQRILLGADAAVLSSANEGIPIALIEAGASGLPVVGTDVGGVREMITPETGLLVPPGDAEQLGQALATLAGSGELRARLGTSAREHVRGHFTAERLVAAMDGVYGDLLGRLP